VSGLSVLKGGKALKSSGDSSKAEFCVKNKMQEKIQFFISGKVKNENDETDVKKELIIPKSGKECVYELPKQVWNYEIVLTEKKETYKKGELKVDDNITITVSE
jgi:hypothetical protein